MLIVLNFILSLILFIIIHIQIMDPDRENSDTTAQRIQRILGNSAFERVSGPLRQSTLRPTVSRDSVSRHQPADELAHAFPSLYRPANNSSASTSRGIQSQAYPYNPQRNYGPSSSSGRRSGRNRSSPYLPHFNTSTHNKPVKGKRRQQAYNDGCVMDMMEFRGNWSEADVIVAIEEAFDEVLAPGPSPK